MIFAALSRALSQLGDSRFQWVLAQGVGLTLLLLFAMYAGVYFLVQWLLPDSFTIPFIGTVEFVETLLSWGSVLLMMLLSIFLMVPVASAFTGLFLDDVADAVEDRHYPNLGPAPRIGLGENLSESASFLLVIVIANIAAFVFYFTPLAPFVFYGLNGFLLGREYYRMIAVRRLGRREATASFRGNIMIIWAAGALMAVPLTIPVVNLLVPILGAATFTHLYHMLNRPA